MNNTVAGGNNSHHDRSCPAIWTLDTIVEDRAALSQTPGSRLTDAAAEQKPRRKFPDVLSTDANGPFPALAAPSERPSQSHSRSVLKDRILLGTSVGWRFSPSIAI